MFISALCVYHVFTNRNQLGCGIADIALRSYPSIRPACRWCPDKGIVPPPERKPGRKERKAKRTAGAPCRLSFVPGGLVILVIPPPAGRMTNLNH